MDALTHKVDVSKNFLSIQTMSYEKVGKDLERCSLGNINLP